MKMLDALTFFLLFLGCGGDATLPHFFKDWKVNKVNQVRRKIFYGFRFGATDTRNRSAVKTITLAAIDYRSPTVSLDGVEINTNGVATIDISGTWFKGSFGKVSNDITVSYRYKSNSSSSWGSWTTIPNVTKNDDGTFSVTVTKNGLSYTETYNFEARV